MAEQDLPDNGSYLTRPPGTPGRDDGHPINLPATRQKCREELNSEKSQTIMRKPRPKHP